MKVVVSEEITEQAKEMLKGFDMVEARFDSEDFENHVKDAEALVIRTYTDINSDLLEKAERLRFVIRCGVGLENVDLDLCEQRNVKVINAPGSNADSVAEHVIMAILASKRNLVKLDNQMREGVWKTESRGRELSGKVIGLIGFGNIGKKVAERLQGFGVNIISYEIYKDHETAKRFGVEFVELDDLIKNSDIISVHVPLLKQTFHMINDESISAMKKGVIIINTARGAIIDEPALIRGLKSGKISFAALDVFEKEPEIDEEIRNMNNVILTPHVAGVTNESFNRMCVQPIKKFLEETGLTEKEAEL